MGLNSTGGKRALCVSVFTDRRAYVVMHLASDDEMTFYGLGRLLETEVNVIGQVIFYHLQPKAACIGPSDLAAGAVSPCPNETNRDGRCSDSGQPTRRPVPEGSSWVRAS